jgi:hypothetical protein
MGAAATKNTTLGAIKRQLAARWPTACQPQHADGCGVLRTGAPAFDALFVDGGVPAGQWVEITGATASGKTSLLFAWLSGLSRGATIAYLDFQKSFFPAAAAAAGVRTDRLLVASPESPSAGVRLAEWILRTRRASCIVFDLVGETRRVPEILCHRLRQEAVRARAHVLFLTTSGRHLIGSSMVALRLHVVRQDPARLRVHIMRSRISRAGVNITWVLQPPRS